MRQRKPFPSAFATGSSIAVDRCQNCSSKTLGSILFLGYLPPVNKLVPIGTIPTEQPSYPTQLLYCPKCHLAQLGLIVDPLILFPPEYPYTSGTTKVLRDNFADLYKESSQLLSLSRGDLIVDIGSNDGTLLSHFKSRHRVLGVTPEEIGRIAIKNGIPTIIDYFTPGVVKEIKNKYGKAKVITAANVFAHMENIHTVIEGIISLMDEKGVFISESHYLLPLLENVQYDTIYHEHIRYYSLLSLQGLLKKHGLEVFHVKNIPSHGGSIRVYAARKDDYPQNISVVNQLKKESNIVTNTAVLKEFSRKTMLSKLALSSMLLKIKKDNRHIYGISAPSRASTLINYVGLDENILDCVVEVKGSYKIGNCIPGTIIPILEEKKLIQDQPEYALLLSWHIANELMPKLVEKGFKGDFIIPLPKPKIIKNSTISPHLSHKS
ncbi:MAG: class I SAM-dependent methyltransferase [bacterium]|nr:class I SAM-dependent methyltransferase [bacterium]